MPPPGWSLHGVSTVKFTLTVQLSDISIGDRKASKCPYRGRYATLYAHTFPVLVTLRHKASVRLTGCLALHAAMLVVYR